MDEPGALSDRITQAPIAFDRARGTEVAQAVAGGTGPQADLMAGAAGCSPYLAGLIERDPEFAQRLLQGSPESLAAEITGQFREAGGADDPGPALRLAKRRISLLAALADLGGVWRLGQVTRALTRFADAAVAAALSYQLRVELGRNRLPGLGEADLADCAGMVVLAMGKMGARELNFSSDIDLFVLFDDARHAAEDRALLRKGFIRVTQRMVRTLSEVTADGYVFRTDLRLRPNPSVTPVCIGMDPAEEYYESHGRTWERAAMIKARACAGAISAGEVFLGRLKPFIWRRHLDFAAIQDAHAMQTAIRDHKGFGSRIVVPGHDVKLGRGGIREIEFFTQTRQLIGGGRDASVRSPETLEALAALEQKRWIEPDVRRQLHMAYVAHRTLEHRLQMVDDAQTHRMPDTQEGLARIAAFCGSDDPMAFEAELRDRFRLVHRLTEEFFTASAAASAQPPPLPEIGSLGFARPEAARDLLEAWPALPALRSSRGRRIFRRLQPSILERLGRAADPDEAIVQFDRFLSGLPAGVQIFSLFDSNPQLLDLLIDICVAAPRLARYLGRNAGVFDAVLEPEFFTRLEGAEALVGQLTSALADAADYETVLDTARRWVKERQFRVGVQLLRGIASPREAAIAYSDIAEACLRGLFGHVAEHLAERHGDPPGNGAAVIAMGKLGSREMTVASDLDLIVVYDGGDSESSTGPRPLPVSTYYARLTKALLSALTVATAEGALYQVDMRLRPSGQKGPVAVSLASFRSYHYEDAWTWEHLALTRARVVAGSPIVGPAVSQVIADVLGRAHDRATVRADVAAMREKLASAHLEAQTGPWDVKHGRGRLMDIELFLQSGILECGLAGIRRPGEMAAALQAKNWLRRDDAEMLAEAIELYSAIQQITTLAFEGELDANTPDSGLVRLLMAATGYSSAASLKENIAGLAGRVAALIDCHFANNGGGASQPESP
ncbi:MAG: bifunctional [glutamine synthetase] adenylyltransferase/[glutamine synthetase]-adenylyl-L-tyrosine phosphorylase [Paracoccaceae bacterium]